MNFELPKKEHSEMALDEEKINVLYGEFQKAIDREKNGGNRFNFESVLARVLDEADLPDLGMRMRMSLALRKRNAQDKEAA